MSPGSQALSASGGKGVNPAQLDEVWPAAPWCLPPRRTFSCSKQSPVPLPRPAAPLIFQDSNATVSTATGLPVVSENGKSRVLQESVKTYSFPAAGISPRREDWQRSSRSSGDQAGSCRCSPLALSPAHSRREVVHPLRPSPSLAPCPGPWGEVPLASAAPSSWASRTWTLL